MALSDVWNDISSYIRVYTARNFDEVPSSPGIYAWYYPIKLPSSNIEDLSIELSSVLNYDSKLKTNKDNNGNIEFNWKNIEVNLKEKHNDTFPPKIKEHWEVFKKDEKSIKNLERMMLVGSILMPPLYIGKTNNLNIRCRQHRSNLNIDENNFHSRFENFTKNKVLENNEHLLTQNVEDLIFVCIKTDTLENTHQDNTKSEELLEEIFKLFARPPYSEK